MDTTLSVRHFEFNYIYIVDSLTPGELPTASDLHNDIVRRRLMNIGFVQSEYVYISNKLEFFDMLMAIRTKIKSGGHFPFLHLEIHGNPEGMVLQSGELLTWDDLTNSLRELNVMLRNNLFLSMATCYSGYIIGSILPSQPSPFFACISTWEKLSGDDIMVSFQSFFDFILNIKPPKKINLTEALQILNDSFANSWRYNLYNSEQIFERVFADYEKDLWHPRKFGERVEYLVKQVFASGRPILWSKNKTRKEIKDKLIRERHQQKDTFKRRFMMSDNRLQSASIN